jgi:hypothetical protein
LCLQKTRGALKRRKWAIKTRSRAIMDQLCASKHQKRGCLGVMHEALYGELWQNGFPLKGVYNTRSLYIRWERE